MAQQFLGDAELAARGIKHHRSHRLRLEKAGKFPKRIYLSPLKPVWDADEIDAWCAARAAERNDAA